MPCGAAICRALAAQDLHVFVHANRNREQADIVVAEIAAAGGSATAVAFDLVDSAHAAGSQPSQHLERPDTPRIVLRQLIHHSACHLPVRAAPSHMFHATPCSVSPPHRHGGTHPDSSWPEPWLRTR